MNELEKNYEELVRQRKKIVEELEELKKNEEIKRYVQLKKQNEGLYQQQLDLLRAIELNNYKTCNHIWVYDRINIEYEEGRTHKVCGCIKCGLNTSVLSFDRECLSSIGKVMYDYLWGQRLTVCGGIKTENVCDLGLAQSIYSKIKENNPDIDDETAIKYFEIALDNIRNIKVNNDRKISRAKRLSLGSKFDRWDSIDVRN